MSAEDLASFRVAIEPPVRTRFGALDVYACGAWCQGPVLLEMLNILAGIDLRAMGHNSVDYAHALTEAIKLAFADRERYFGDPRFVDVPVATLLSDAYAGSRRALLRPDRAWPGMPPAGDIPGQVARDAPAPSRAPRIGRRARHLVRQRHRQGRQRVCGDAERSVVRHAGDPGNGSLSVVARVAELGRPGASVVRSAGQAAAPDADGARWRSCPTAAPCRSGRPAATCRRRRMLQVLLNITVFGMNPQQAVEAPRFASYSFPDSFEPHSYSPGLLYVENRVPQCRARRPRIARPRRGGLAGFRLARRRGVRAARRSRERRHRGRRRSAAPLLRGRLVASGARRRNREPHQTLGNEPAGLVAQHHDEAALRPGTRAAPRLAPASRRG